MNAVFRYAIVIPYAIAITVLMGDLFVGLCFVIIAAGGVFFDYCCKVSHLQVN
jgi:hypothetical protein